MSYERYLYFILIIVFGSGCSILSKQEIKLNREQIARVSPKSRAEILKYFNTPTKLLSKKSAFYSLSDPKDAFSARVFLVDHAKKSLDVQYYIYENDKTGLYFSYRLLEAANRGVKVRILIDDLSSTGLDKEWRSIAEHPNIELKLFNPNRLRSSFRNLALLLNIDSLGKRMHNKSLIADRSIAILGGRNIGDVYFAADKETLFFDYDILTVGRVVSDIQTQFEIYWNSKESVSSEKLLEGSFTSKDIKHNKKEFENSIISFKNSILGKSMKNSSFLKDIYNGGVELTVAEDAHLYYDYPEKVISSEDDIRTHLSSRISIDLKEVKKDLIVISPYFIPSKEMMQSFYDMRSRGVHITVVTNSLASTDVFPVYSGYRWYIKDLIEMGIELYELKPQSFKKYSNSKKWLKTNKTSLHTKMMVIDGYRFVVGSANIDPRSSKLNTELLLIIDSKKMANKKQIALKSIINMENFYRLSWGIHPLEPEDDNIPIYGIIWSSRENGKIKRYFSPPNSGYFRRLGTDLLSILPIEGYL